MLLPDLAFGLGPRLAADLALAGIVARVGAGQSLHLSWTHQQDFPVEMPQREALAHLYLMSPLLRRLLDHA